MARTVHFDAPVISPKNAIAGHNTNTVEAKLASHYAIHDTEQKQKILYPIFKNLKHHRL